MNPPTTAADAECLADQLRGDLATTLDLLAGNLDPPKLASEIFRTARSKAPEPIARFLDFAQSPTGYTIIGAVIAFAAVFAASRRRRGASIDA